MGNKFLFLGLFVINLCFGQFTAKEYDSEEFNRFKASKTFIVLTGNEKFDTELTKSMSNIWKTTPYSTISSEEFEKKIADKTASFICLFGNTNPNVKSYHYLALINGGKKTISRYEYQDLIAYAPINFFINESNLTDCAYRVSNMIESMVLSIDLVQKNNIKGSTLSIVKELGKIYLKRSPKIKERTLLICEESINKKVLTGSNVQSVGINYLLTKDITKDDIAALYPFKYEICSKEKIEKVIKEKNKDYYYLQPAITVNKTIFVFDPVNGEVVYFDFTMMGALNFNKGNLKDLAKAIK
ncbi:hypothetical protein B0A78_11315 [Flavobacterium columnare NBRC 100251 = ATCC 23463]|uniref:Uncharacterized protein n=1 Tax=Flavobacterium columnare (strain ATCC 49512 / CIP 103533 / TG 44/87) TaxID=1041826 RepID=G8X792_FLACA|nr:hypothetical protein [Flavobacterium columnare]AEW87077.1 hypothetical protein FCOL_11370 [Flavobacterium columnare ATCC 49512]OOB82758.1 hypothetical protein BZL53_07270 [Flavobacterium columnare]PDS22695.1 hypothetical protein B0A78_11315 [Flavobacterium columnare NBRC 100251 = ATCC 23463]GEM58003.1 hypothetical protein FC1_12410 [Flavobacterium columnare NBRC 100251 = ATCC 23463]